MQPVIAMVTTCKGRTLHLERTLPQNLWDNASYPNVKFIVLNYSSPDDLMSYLRDQHMQDIESGRLVVYSYPGAEKFQMAHAKNMAHRLGILEGADILVNLDADNFTGAGFARYIAEQFYPPVSSDPRPQPIFLWGRMIKEGEGRLARGISGRIVVTKNAFLKAGGYDEKYTTWAPDDKDFNARLRRLGYLGVEIDRSYLEAIMHTDKMRFREYPQARDAAAEYEFEIAGKGDATIVNYGDIGCGVVYRNFDHEPIALAPIPTRIFGIGMHKTATTSLDAALTALGFESAHWKSAHWAKKIWHEMQAGRSPTLESSYAVCDLPIPVLYKELDRAYPGSKFILTVRDEAGWIKSVRNHWDREHNRFRAGWDSDPFTHKIHREIYGQKNFDEAVFLERYRRHNAEVKEYFKGRPRDLLVMDMDGGAGWYELCAFLGEPVPQAQYPVEFATKQAKKKKHWYHDPVWWFAILFWAVVLLAWIKQL